MNVHTHTYMHHGTTKTNTDSRMRTQAEEGHQEALKPWGGGGGGNGRALTVVVTVIFWVSVLLVMTLGILFAVGLATFEYEH